MTRGLDRYWPFIRGSSPSDDIGSKGEILKPWNRKAVQRFGWPPLWGYSPTPLEVPRVYWYQVGPGDGVAIWECPCGANGDGLFVASCRFKLWRHLRRCNGALIKEAT